MDQSHGSPRLVARLGGLLYVTIIVVGGAGYSLSSSLIQWDDAAATASAIASSSQAWRLSIAAMLVMLVCDVGLACVFYVLFRPVSRAWAVASLAFRLVMASILGAAVSTRVAPLVLLGADQEVTPQAEQTILFLLRLFERTFDVALVFFGMACLATGWLIARSTFLPRIFGVMMLAAGACYLIDTLGKLVLPQLQPPFDLQLIAYAAEIALALWLLIVGVNAERWRAILRARSVH